MGKLTARKVETAQEGSYSDGDNLFLRVRASGSRAWVFRYVQDGKPREIGMGSLSLADARDKAEDMRKAVRNGTDPLHVIRPPEEVAKRTFKAVALETIEALRPGWKNAKHCQQWENTLRDYAYPVLGDMPVDSVTVTDVLKVLSPIWYTKTETATRLRQRIEAVLYRASAKGERDRFNPASWKGNLQHLLPPPRKVQEREHFAAVEYLELPAVMAVIRKQTSMSALCLRVIVLTACRSGEIRGMQWEEVNLENKVLTIPASRTKTQKEHVVPLADEVVEILSSLSELSTSGSVFTARAGKPLSDVAISKALHLAAPGTTVHGMRSAFRDWAGDKTHHQREVIEQCLAHAVGGVEGAYRRGDALEKRRKVMNDWAAYLAGQRSNVVSLSVAS